MYTSEYYSRRLKLLTGCVDAEQTRHRMLVSAAHLSGNTSSTNGGGTLNVGTSGPSLTLKKQRTALEDKVKHLEKSLSENREVLVKVREQIEGARKDNVQHDALLLQHKIQLQLLQGVSHAYSKSHDPNSEKNTAILTATKFIEERIQFLECTVEPDVQKQLADVVKRISSQEAANAGLSKDAERHRLLVEDEVKEQRQHVRALREAHKRLSDEVAASELILRDSGRDPKAMAASVEVLEEVVRSLQEQLVDVEKDRLALEEERKGLVHRILKAREQSVRMNETMMLLKSAIIHLARDYHFIGTTRKKIEKMTDKEAVFKEAHNVIKVAVCNIGAKKRVPHGQPPQVKWNITEAEIAEKLDDHRVRTVFRALQEMVIAWDMMPMSVRSALSTTEEIVENAYTLYAVARHTMHKMNVRIAEQRALLETNTPRLSAKAGGVGGGPSTITTSAAEGSTSPHDPERGPAVVVTTPKRNSYSYGRSKRDTPPTGILASPSSSTRQAKPLSPFKPGVGVAGSGLLHQAAPPGGISFL